MARMLLIAFSPFFVVCSLAALANVTMPSTAVAQGRLVALVVGVAKYEHANTLANAIDDAVDMTAVLRRLGFDVETLVDPSRAALEDAVRRYGDRSVGAEASVFHYSGHALEAGGRNWILPATANINSQRDLRFEAMELNTILEQTDGAARVSIVFLDACRDHPFSGRLSATGRNLSRGLARIEMTASGVLVAFSTAPGQVALDGVSIKKNSPFTAALLHHIETAGLEIKGLLARVTKDVVEATKGKQRPWQNSSLEGEFYFLPPPVGTAAPVAPAAVNLDVVFWDTIKSSRDPADFKAYLTQFPKGTFVALARNRLAMLQQATAIPPQTVISTPQAPQEQPSPAVQQAQSARPPATASPLRDLLLARFAALSVAADEAASATRTYEADAGHKAIAVAVKAHRTWRWTRLPTGAAAATKTLEGCQVYYGEPCTLVAIDDKVEPTTHEAPVLRDMPRTRYTGSFDVERIPAARGNLVRRADVTSYRTAAGPKAAAYHVWGRLFVVTGAAGQFEAEEQALAQCNNDPDRKGAGGPCFLYAAGNQVVLPQRLTKPRLRPQTISEALAYLAVPGYAKADVYFQAKGHKAIAIVPESGQSFRQSNQSSAARAEELALESCQLTYHTPCVLLASDDALHAPDPWTAPRRDMPRLHYTGTYKPESVPLFAGVASQCQSYAGLPAPKAMVVRPQGGRCEIATAAALEEAQAKALAACNDDSHALPCFVYAVNDRVILDQRRTEPLR